MKATVITAPGETRVVDVPKPTVGPNDVLVRMRACGICGSDGLYISMGGLRQGTDAARSRAGRRDRRDRQCGHWFDDRRPRRRQPDGRAQRNHRQRRRQRCARRIPAHRGRGPRQEPRGRARPHPVRGGRAQRTDGRGPPRRQPVRTETVRQGRDLRCRPDRAGRHHRVQIRWRQPCGGRRPDSRATGEGPRRRRRRRDQLRRRGRRGAADRTARPRRVDVSRQGGHRYLLRRRGRSGGDQHRAWRPPRPAPGSASSRCTRSRCLSTSSTS